MEKYRCKMDGKTVRCECGGQVAVGGAIYPTIDIKIGIVGDRLHIKGRHSKKAAGYIGFCLKCHKEGRFILETPHGKAISRQRRTSRSRNGA